ncbi:3-oxoacyl-[acyl-carrier-protein] synthase III C-terminal domain-containing protein [Nonomuraea sp. NPDC046570]|uniref:type III polyketide synthase n=1 Tax=Nonomuraea sp. NPDC046570 TaxID=3155255 RepID=UPI00340354DC
MTRIASVSGVLPPNRYTQSELTDLAARMCLPDGVGRRLLDRLHAAARVETRHLALPIEQYGKLDGFGAANDAFITAAVDLGAQAVGEALDAAGLTPGDVDLIMFTSVTGVAAPSVDARLAGRLGLRPDVKRVPVFGLGCVAGAAGIARLHDYLRGWPGHVAVLLSVELCSLTLQRGDSSTANLVAGALFGDGAAAVVALGADRAGGRGPAVVATRGHLYPDSEHVMGWDVRDSGFGVVLDAGVPDVVRTYLADDVHAFLGDHGLTTKDVTAWVCHPGGPKVLEAVAETLDLPFGALDLTWRSLAANGNLSSASVLHVLRDTLALRPPEPGTPGLLIAMGPGFCSELVLLRW